ncbi:glycosyltransferase family 87 protein [Corynebacterium aquilae]|uniref:glycosyltransferase family 87 protein n=1 Tax=Corynebacterium aquilae TaxID=203263 RepID=UPI000AB8D902|nr:glycosyltransferase family 87 protein [Corynebacterium aquilae]
MTSRREFITSLWNAPARPKDADPLRAHSARFASIGNVVAWPLALILVIHRVAVLAMNGSITDDFSTVYYALRRFIEGVPVYNENYAYVDPHYLYSPGATLFLSPLGYLTDFDAARTAFVIVNAAAIIVALGILTRLFGWKLSSPVWPVSIALAFLTEAVRNTLVFSNINGLLLLALVGFLWLMMHNKLIAAGVVLGFAGLVKPIFLPLLFLPFVKMQWRTVATGVAVPIVMNIVAWPLVPGAGDYVTRLMPYLKQTRDYANSSLSGQAVFYQMPGWQEKFWQVFFAAVVAAGVIFLLRYRNTDPLLWMATTSGLLLCGVFFLSSLGQMYYSMLLFPLLFTVLRARSVMHTPVAWVAAYLFLTPEHWVINDYERVSVLADYAKPTFGWALLLVVISTTAVTWWLSDRRPPAATQPAPLAPAH